MSNDLPRRAPAWRRALPGIKPPVASEIVTLRGGWDTPVIVEAHVERGATPTAVRLIKRFRQGRETGLQVMTLDPEDIGAVAELLTRLAVETAGREAARG